MGRARSWYSDFTVEETAIQEAEPPGMSLALLKAVLFRLIFQKDKIWTR